MLHRMPPLISYVTAPLWMNVLFFINFLLLILEPLYIKNFKYKFNVILAVMHIFLNSVFLIYLFLNFKLIEIDRNIFLPVSEIYYYKLTFYLFITYFSIVIYNSYDNLLHFLDCNKWYLFYKIKKCFYYFYWIKKS